MNVDQRVVVVGGGVIGLTVALALEGLAGHPTVVVTDGRDVVGAEAPSADVASLHAAASILPHSVRGPRTSGWTEVTSDVLDAVAADPAWGIRVQTHMEVYEAEAQPLPSYHTALEGFTLLDPAVTPVPRRRPDVPLSGWSFDVRFCEGSMYLRRLAGHYEEVGGTILVGGRTTLADIVRAGARHVVNCTGHAGRRFAADAAAAVDDIGAVIGLDPMVDEFETRYIIGHYLRVRRPDLLRGPDGRVLSYSYSPGSEVYANAAGAPADVYCYSRSDAWLLGGSRIPVEGGLRAAHDLAQSADGDVVAVPDANGQLLAIPRQIIDVNHDLIASYTQGTIDLKDQIRRDPASVWAGYGFRAERRDPEDSTRVSCSTVAHDGARVVVGHCYGHGGSGFTLAWGCAIDIVQRMREAVDRSGAAPLPAVAPRRGVGALGDVVLAHLGGPR